MEDTAPVVLLSSQQSTLRPSHLFEHEEGHDSLRGEESRDEDHDDAHRDAGIQAGQSRDPPAAGDKTVF